MGIKALKLYHLEELNNLKVRAEKNIQSLYEKEVTIGSVAESIRISEEIILLIKKANFLDNIRIFKNYQPFLHTHPFLVSVISVMICRKMDWNNDRTLKAVALGGLLHDIGMSRMPGTVRHQHPEELSNNDRVIYETHPEAGMKMMSDFSEVPASVLQIILQHHELNGTGYPGKITDPKIYPLAKIVCLADRFTRFILKKDLLIVDGIKAYAGDKFEIMKHDPDLVRAFIRSFIKEDRQK